MISILGCGWYGFALAKSLIEKGYEVKGSTTSSEKLIDLQEAGVKPYLFDFSADGSNNDDAADFFNSDVLFVAIPPKKKSGEAAYYPQKIESICRAASRGSIKHLILISSTGVYPNLGSEVDELSDFSPNNELAQALLSAENIAKSHQGFTCTILRFGGLFGLNRNPGRFLAGKKLIANGLAPVNMIHLNDCIGISHAILEKQAFGHVYNACSPQHPSRAEFYQQAALSAGLEAPDFIPERVDWKIVNSKNIPRLLAYKFKETLI